MLALIGVVVLGLIVAAFYLSPYLGFFAVVALLYYTISPFPLGTDDRIWAHSVDIVFRILADRAWLASKLGFGKEAALFRSLLENYMAPKGQKKGSADLVVQDTTFDGVKVRVYDPKSRSRENDAALVYYHGGGWVLLSVDSYDRLTSYMAKKLGVVVVSVDYRLAPEHPYPAAFDDCVSATAWFLGHAADYGVDPSRVAIAGDSAGGNLSAAVAREMTFNRGAALRFHAVMFGALQAVDFSLPAYRQNRGAGVLSLHLIAKFWAWYLGGEDSQALLQAMLANRHISRRLKSSPLVTQSLDLLPEKFERGRKRSTDPGRPEPLSDRLEGVLADPSCSPLLGSEFKGLPPAFVVTAEQDVLRDDGILYAQKLEKAGVEVKWINYDHGVHGIFSGKKCLRDFMKYAHENLSL